MIEAAILHYCKYQERCHQEARNKLYELGFTADEVERQVSMLIEAGVLNEERFARAYAGGRFRMKQWGREKIRKHLKMKKVSDYCIKKALAEIESEDYENTLNKIVFNKWSELKSVRSQLKKKSKMYRYLIQKGYEKDLVIVAINNCVNNV